MPLALVKVKFGSLSIGAKFIGHIPGKVKKRTKFVKKWDTAAVFDGDTTFDPIYQFKKTDEVFVWRWVTFAYKKIWSGPQWNVLSSSRATWIASLPKSWSNAKSLSRSRNCANLPTTTPDSPSPSSICETVSGKEA